MSSALDISPLGNNVAATTAYLSDLFGQCGASGTLLPGLSGTSNPALKDVFRIFERYSYRNVASYKIADVVDARSNRLVTSHARTEFLEIEPKLISTLV